jgi:hypothetical protein
MARIGILGYVLLLALAFALGLMGTIAASQAVLTRATRQKTTLEKPVQLPASPVRKDQRPTIEC